MKLPQGYRYSSVYAGIRHERKDDIALIVSDTAAAAAAMFTTNRVQAAPLRLGRKHLQESQGRVRAVLINAGNANCATRTGDQVALQCCEALAKALDVPVSQVFPSSTGVIGVELDPALITDQIPDLVERLSPDRLPDVAAAIMTTDTVSKKASTELHLAGGTVRIAGVTKGSGMIHPNMATTLTFLMSDVLVEPVTLWEMMAPAVEESYHRLSVDGETSTNDTVLVMANGASGVELADGERKAFLAALTSVMQDLAIQIARDGEGAKKLVTIDVMGAPNQGAAVAIARSIANSPLVKTAIAGGDPNWGRILAAAGKAGAPFDPAAVDVYLQGVLVCKGGLASEFDLADMESRLAQSECSIRFVIRGRDKGQARFWTCDLTEGYIRINADYHT